MSSWNMLMHALTGLPYIERLAVGSVMLFAATSIVCKLVELTDRDKQPVWHGATIFGALAMFLFSFGLLVNDYTTPVGLGGMLGYVVVGLTLLRRHSIEASKPRKGPWG